MLDEPNFLQLLLFSAVRENNVDKLRDFMNIDYGGHWYECRTQSGDNPLHLASQLGHMDTVRFLFEVWKPAVSVLEMNNMYGKTCLHDAAQGSHPEVVKYLIERGAVTDALKMGDWTPLMLASTKTGENAALTVLELLKSGANTKLRNKDGWTALHIAVRAGDPTVISHLLNYDSNMINVRTNNGRTVLHIAAFHGNEEAVKKILNTGQASLNKTDSCSLSPLLEAARRGHTRIVKLLIGAGASLEQTDFVGLSSVHLAAESGNVALIDYLVLQCGLSPNFRNSPSGVTPLHWAARCDRLNSVKHLLRLGGDPSLRECNNHTAFDVAFGENQEEIRRVLKEHSDRNAAS